MAGFLLRSPLANQSPARWWYLFQHCNSKVARFIWWGFTLSRPLGNSAYHFQLFRCEAVQDIFTGLIFAKVKKSSGD